MIALPCLPLALALAAPQPQDDPAQQFRAAKAVYEPLAARNEELLLEGRMAEATRALLDAVPESERTAAHAFLLGNMLFAMDFEQSFKLHEEAWKKDPKAPPVILEWAIELHRKGRHADAEKLYRQLVDESPGGGGLSQVHALRADCLLHLGQARQACAAWKAADAYEYSAQVESAASWVYGDVSPETRRCRLLAKARAGDAGALADVVILDLHWDRDWWNTDIKKSYLERDLAEAAKGLGPDDVQYRTLAFLAKWTQPADDFLEFLGAKGGARPPTGTEDVRADATALGVLGPKRTLPKNSRVASRVLGILIDREVATAAELQQHFETELRRRADSKAGDVDALEALAALYVKTQDPKLAEIARIGWNRYADRRFACDLLAAKKDKLVSSDPVLQKAIALNPSESAVTSFAVQCAQREGKALVEALSRQAMAEFAHMAFDEGVQAAFAALDKALVADGR